MFHAAPLLGAAFALAGGLSLSWLRAPGAPPAVSPGLCLLLSLGIALPTLITAGRRIRPGLARACIGTSLLLSGLALGTVSRSSVGGMADHPALAGLPGSGVGIRLAGRIAGVPRRRGDILQMDLFVDDVEGEALGRIRGPRVVRLSVRGGWRQWTEPPLTQLLPGDRIAVAATLRCRWG